LHLGNNTADGTRLVIDPDELCTHAVAVGMTGSGKTGLVMTMLEELLLAGVPAIAIDPKGDLANLRLQCRSSKEFDEWGTAGVERAQAYTQAVEDWQISARSHRLRQLAERVTVYTPASSAGVPVNVLRSFAAPELTDPEALEERIATTTSGLLALLGVRAAPHQSDAHALISTIVAHAWQAGEDIDLYQLVEQIAEPPVDWIGAQDIDDYMTPRRRRKLAARLNTLLASPRFAAWLRGKPIDIKGMLYTPDGQPRVSVVSIAHLEESERQFIVTILLSEYIAYMRTLAGSETLRSCVVIDECTGYIPPVREPSSKRPLLTLLKQGRAYGTGVVLATQNPIDLDYKALSNAGTWFVGRLQTERDRSRLLAGMPNNAGVERMLDSLGKRTFAVHSVKQDGLRRLLVRQTCSYLRGPMTRPELQRLLGTVDTETDVGPQVAALQRRYDAVLRTMASLQTQARQRAGSKQLASVIALSVGGRFQRAHALSNAMPQSTAGERAKLDRCKRQLAQIQAQLQSFGGDAMAK